MEFDKLGTCAQQTKIAELTLGCGTRVLDCGITAQGGIDAGIRLAKISLAGKGRVDLCNGDPSIWPGPWVQIATDQPVAACMLSQYAGWPVKHGEFFAMGSGPMRVKRGKEALLKSWKVTDSSDLAVGTLECDVLPQDETAAAMADECGVSPDKLCLAVAPTRSLAGIVQVVARSVETALHKLHELEFPIANVQSAWGTAPMPPPTPDFAGGIGRTNDAILYGARVSLWVDGQDDRIADAGARLPSSSSKDFGEPFHEIFARYNYDFYQIDPGLFSPASVLIMNIRTGRSWRFGAQRADLISKSFSTEGI